MKRLLTAFLLCVAFSIGISQQKNTDSFVPAMPEGGWDSFKAKFFFPEIARRAQLEGGVLAIFTIDTTGAIQDTVRFPVSTEFFNMPVRRAIHSTKWIPAKRQGNPVASSVSFSVFFTIRDAQNHKRLFVDTTRAKMVHER